VRYVDLQRRRDEQARGVGERTSSWYGIKSNPYLLMVAGLILAYPAAATSFDIGDLGFISLLPWIPSATLFTLGFRQLWNRRPAGPTPKFGGEKQLLMVLRDVGSITPIQAALETSLTVDEAEEILSCLANRGHLYVESRDGTLYYVLPSSHSSKRL
jgi:hypothetical protein